MPQTLAMRYTFLSLALLCCASGAKAEPAVLNDVEVLARQVTLKLSRPAGYKISSAAKPPAVVVTLEDTRIAEAVREKSSISAWVLGIAALPLSTGSGEGARVVIKLVKPRNVSPEWRGNDMVLLLSEPAPKEAAAPPAAPAPVKPAAPAPPAASAAPAARPAPVPSAPPAEKPSAKPEEEAALPPPPPRLRFRVQAGSFAAEDAAAKLKAEIEAKVSPVEVRKAEAGGKTLYRVLVGESTGRAKAQATLKKLAELGHAGFIIKE